MAGGGPRTAANTVRGPRNHLAADRPRATTTGGSSSSSWRRSQPLQRATSGALGVRLAGGRHFTTLRMAQSARSSPASASSRSSSAPDLPTNGRPVSSSVAPGASPTNATSERPETGTSPTTTCCRTAASAGQATQERATAASESQSGAAAATAATSSAAAPSRGGRRSATPATLTARPEDSSAQLRRVGPWARSDRTRRKDRAMTAPDLDVYDIAFLAGGPNRTVETAIVALVLGGRLRSEIFDLPVTTLGTPTRRPSRHDIDHS